ncbi:hypothetical protein ACIBQ1_40645 [Nonomuraea sp. NPDC050153]|uniref:hypothetical protein n=1 Tax=Nonomuraea sp. NPDC050153 TaxID=3364359 RepID=UPI00379A538F
MAPGNTEGRYRDLKEFDEVLALFDPSCITTLLRNESPDGQEDYRSAVVALRVGMHLHMAYRAASNSALTSEARHDRNESG